MTDDKKKDDNTTDTNAGPDAEQGTIADTDTPDFPKAPERPKPQKD